MEITKDMIISDVLNLDRGTVPIFFKNGLHCLGCAMASGETIEEASWYTVLMLRSCFLS